MNYVLSFFIFVILSTLPVSSAYAEIEKTSPACLIAHQIKNSLDHQDKKYIKAIIKGIEAQDNNLQLTAEEKNVKQFANARQREWQAQNNLEASEIWLLQKNSVESIKTIVPLKLLYLTIKEGDGKKLTGLGNVQISYAINKFNRDIPEATGEHKFCDLSQMIPGLCHGMISMQEGEIRKIYIHPDFAYGISNTFEANIALEATVELLAIPSEQSEIEPLKDIAPIKKQTITQNEIDELLLKSYYVAGWKLWNHLKFGYQLFSKEQLIDYLEKDIDPVLSDSEFNREINRIHWVIYHQRVEDEYKASGAFFDKLSGQSDVKCIVSDLLYCKSQSKLNKNPTNKNLYQIRSTIKDRFGEILQRERTETIDINSAIRGLKEGLPHLTLGKPATLYVHPKWGFPDNDGPLGDKLLVIDVIVEDTNG